MVNTFMYQQYQLLDM